MNIFITLDYEIFFGEATKNIEKYLIEPTNRLLNELDKYNKKAVFFIDIGYVIALKKQMHKHIELQENYKAIVTQISDIDDRDHEIGLHMHPHWEDCYYDGKKWHMHLSRFKLADFNKEKAKELFIQYHKELSALVQQKIISYRAGGWCLEPFHHIKEAMEICGIKIDSSVFSNGKSTTKTHHFNYTNYPNETCWNFKEEPKIINAAGPFIEIPISSHSVKPNLYWKVLFDRLFNKKKNQGKGKSTKPSKIETLKKLFTSTTDVLSIDNYKANLLITTVEKYFLEHKKNICIIGHPKCFSNETFLQLEQLLRFSIHKNAPIKLFKQMVPSNALKIR
ncbi:polysaccharide deacetylase family protein [Hydrotalea sandarakina]|jgi:hypothetical protein|uniref:Polysaccharide deacetylase n=1 Tax=Hydrotalea sandarakina TaxID=1004304 RepID=A0A2W7RVH2_9BACT|nr:hypothetical protein [Hydrotalea sandarakina]PZX64698.1 hypothetical protein LX80_00898 [Hydrotalea sandarakina]